MFSPNKNTVEQYSTRVRNICQSCYKHLSIWDKTNNNIDTCYMNQQIRSTYIIFYKNRNSLELNPKSCNLR